MNFHKNFLPGDVEQAIKELDCLGYLLGRILNNVENGNFEFAKSDMDDAMKSLSELVKMSESKRTHDQMLSIVHQLRKDDKLKTILMRW